MAVYQELAQGDTLMLENSRIRLERKSGQRARLMIDSDLDIEVVKAGEPIPAETTAPSLSASTPPPATAPAPFLKRPSPAAN